MIRKKPALRPQPDGWVPVFPRDKHEAFARRWRDDGIVPLICPTCQNVFAGIAQSIHASDRHATLHGVVFDILVGSERLVLPELVMNRRSEPQNPHASSV